MAIWPVWLNLVAQNWDQMTLTFKRWPNTCKLVYGIVMWFTKLSMFVQLPAGTSSMTSEADNSTALFPKCAFWTHCEQVTPGYHFLIILSGLFSMRSAHQNSICISYCSVIAVCHHIYMISLSWHGDCLKNIHHVISQISLLHLFLDILVNKGHLLCVMAISCHFLLLHFTAHLDGWLSGLCWYDSGNL